MCVCVSAPQLPAKPASCTAVQSGDPADGEGIQQLFTVL